MWILLLKKDGQETEVYFNEISEAQQALTDYRRNDFEGVILKDKDLEELV